MIQFGIGDALLHYPGLLTPPDEIFLRGLPHNFVAVHPFASAPQKALRVPELLFDQLRYQRVEFIVLGNEWIDYPAHKAAPGVSTHLETLRRARKFIGTLSMFNCAAQVMRKPSFVIVNRSIKEPYVYGLMAQNEAVVRAWNDGHDRLDLIYADAAKWASV